MKTLLVTGGCGFIGSHFIRLALDRAEWRVVNLDKLTYAGSAENLRGIDQGPRYRFVRGDISDRTLVNGVLREERPWAVVNFAAESHVDRSILDSLPFLQTNVVGVQVLLEAARGSGVEKFLQVSTDEVYGDADGKDPFAEDSTLGPSSPYSASKAAADLLCMAYRRTYSLPVLIVRSSNNYGPFQFPEKFIPLMIRNALRRDEMPVYGDGNQVRDWLYVDDNVDAILRVLEQGRDGSIYNVGTGEGKTNLELLRTLCQCLAENLNEDSGLFFRQVRFVTDRPGHDRRYALDNRKIREELGWTHRVRLEEGLARTVRWYLDHQDWLARVTSGEYQAYYEGVYVHGWRQST